MDTKTRSFVSRFNVDATAYSTNQSRSDESLALGVTKGQILYALSILAGSAFLAVTTQWSLPIGVVPVSLQTLSVLLLGAALGRRRAALSVIAYLVEGAFGLPVFAGGKFGILHLMGPTGGYLIGFIGAAYLVGLLRERGLFNTFKGTFVSFFAGHSLIYIVALPWLGEYVGKTQAFKVGLLPFAFGDILKVTFATVLVLGIKSIRNRKTT